MAETLPYMNSTGLLPKILDKIKEAKTPDRFSQDYLGTVLGFAGGSAKPFIPLAKRLNLINSDGTPSDYYKRFRGSEEESQSAMAHAVRAGYAPLYKRNEHAHHLERRRLEGLVREITGLEEGSSAVRAIVGTFEALKKYANFDSGPIAGGEEPSEVINGDVEQKNGGNVNGGQTSPVRFGYTININLPDTNDITVFNAIFKSMKEHLL